MAFENENGSGIPATMLVGPATFGNNAPMPYYYPVGGNNGGNGMFGNDGSWIILLIIVLLAAGGGWGNNNNSGGFGGQPIVINDGGNYNGVQRGFDQAAIMSGLNGITAGISNIGTQLCSGFSGVTAAVTGAQNALAQQMYGNTIADMERSFAVQSALQNCCCENRAGLADVKYTIATEECATRSADANNTRDIIEAQTRGTQAVLDKLCSLELDAKNDEIARLRQEVYMKDLSASQIAQTAQIKAGQVAEIDAMYNRLRDCPVPSMPVYGMTPIFTCNQNQGCGCGCNGTF